VESGIISSFWRPRFSASDKLLHFLTSGDLDLERITSFLISSGSMHKELHFEG